jgi:hypothetical protein
MSTRVFEFKVEGEKPFPYKLLSSDECYPASLEDADAIGICAICGSNLHYRDGGKLLPKPQKRTIKLRKHASYEPNYIAWQQAGWRIIEILTDDGWESIGNEVTRATRITDYLEEILVS